MLCEHNFTGRFAHIFSCDFSQNELVILYFVHSGYDNLDKMYSFAAKR